MAAATGSQGSDLVEAFAFHGVADAKAAEELERSFSAGGRLEDRTRLLGYYVGLEKPSDAEIDLKLKHLKALIRARPNEAFLSVPLSPLDERNATIAAEWRAQARHSAATPAVLVNAAMFLLDWDSNEAITLVEEAIRAEPRAPRWRIQLGRLLLLTASELTNGAGSCRMAARALHALMAGMALMPSCEHRFVFSDLAEAALLCKESEAAHRYATQALAAAQQADWATGILAHTAHMVLGSLACDAGQRAPALDHLEQSLSVPRSPQFHVRGPATHLLSRLILSGESGLVETYVARWTARFGLPEGWSIPQWHTQ